MSFGVWLVPLASAHNSLITVSMNCNGSASYTANAWAGPTSGSRTNTDVRVFSSVDNGSTWTQVGQGQFTPADNYSFSGSFAVGTSRSVRVRVQEFANWGDGVKPSGPGTASGTRPLNCTTTPSTTATTTTATTTTGTTTRGTTTTPTTTTATTPTTTPSPPTPPTTTASTPPPTVTAGGPALISIVKSERVGGTGTYVQGPVTVVNGQTLDYQILVVNSGAVELTVTLSDPNCDAGTLHAGGTTTLTPGKSVTYTCTHRFVAANASPFVNTATATGVSAGGEKVGPVSSQVSASRRPGSVLGKSVTKVTARAKVAKAVPATAHFTG